MKSHPKVSSSLKTFLRTARAGRNYQSETTRVAALLLTGLLSASAMAAEDITLGAAQHFTILGASTVTSTGPTVITGNLGLSPGSAITGFPPGSVVGGAIHINDALAVQAHADALSAFNQLAGEARDTNLTGVDLGGLTLTPGVYHFDTSAQLTGALKLDTGGDPNAAFHFQIGTTLTTSSGAEVTLLGLNAGSDSNIFWQVGSSATLGSDTNLSGNIIALASVTFNTGATLADGKALALNGAVTLDSNLINANGPAVPLSVGSFWNGNNSHRWSQANWSPDATGATTSTLAQGADVVFSVTGTVPQNQHTILDFNAAISSLTVNDPAAVSISGPKTLSIFGVGAQRGITVTNGAGLVTINSALELTGLADLVTVDNAAGLVINGVVSGNVGLTKAGSGRLTLSGANTYAGATNVVQGTLRAGAANVISNTSALTVESGSVFNLNSHNQNVGSIANGPTGGGSITLGSALLTTGGDNTSTLFSGIISGRGQIAKVGTGAWTLGGTNTYTGTTGIRAGTLAAAADHVISNQSAVSVDAGAVFNVNSSNQSIGSLAGAGSTLLGSGALVTGNDDTSRIYSGVIAGSGTVTKAGSGTWQLTGANTFSGLTTVNAGELVVNGSLAGSGQVTGGILRGVGTISGDVVNDAAVLPGLHHSAGTLNVGGNYTQSTPGEIRIRLGSPATYDRLTVGGRASLSGGLNVNYLNGFNAKPGDVFTIITTGDGVSGKFTRFSDPHATGTLLTLGVVYQPKNVLLEFVQGSFAQAALRGECYQNQREVGRALDKLAAERPRDGLILQLDTLPIGRVPAVLSRLSPEDYASIFTAGLALSQVQVGNLERRLSDVRNGSSGFSDSGLAVTDSHGSLNYDGKSTVATDGKSAKEFTPQAIEQNRWGFFVSGTGQFGDLESTCGARGSSFVTGGVTVGADYRISNNFVLGAAFGYANTHSDLSRDGNLSIDSGKGSLYASYYDNGFYVNGIAGAGYSSIETRRKTFKGSARGDTNATDFNGLIGTGYDVHMGDFTIGPVASVQFGTIGLDSFQENGAIGAVRVGSQSQDTLKSAVGLKASYTKKVGGMTITPEVRAQWQHEFMDARSSIDARFSSGSDFTVKGPRIGRDAVVVDVGASAQVSQNVALFAYYTGELGRENYTLHSVTGGVRVSF